MRIDFKTTSPVPPGKNIAKIRWAAWLLIAALSVFFTEVVSGGTPSVFVNIYGLLVITPLYFLQMMVLLPLLFRLGRPSVRTLYFAGAVFGLFEAYITKVIWQPVDYPVDLFAGGVAVATTLMLVFFWHPLMSMVIPLFTADGLLNAHKTLKIELPFQRLQRVKPVVLLAGLGALMGLIQGAALGNPVEALFSAVSSTLIIWVLIRVWRYLAGKTVFTLSQLLPSQAQWRIFAFLLAAYYLVLTFTLRADAFPVWPGHVIVAGLYLLMGGLWLRSRKQDQEILFQPAPETPPVLLNLNTGRWLIFSGGFIALSAAGGLLPVWGQDGVHFALWGAGILCGLAAFGWFVWQMASRLKLNWKLPDFRRLFYTLKARLRPVTAPGLQFRVPKPRLDIKALLRKALAFTRSGSIHRP
ncbi:MAG: hypothetical protein AAGU05_04225 [Anaerolineaceae bacterium]